MNDSQAVRFHKCDIYDYIIASYGVPQLYVLGMTISLAWQLPTDASFFHRNKNYASASKRKDSNDTTLANTQKKEEIKDTRNGVLLYNRYTGKPLTPFHGYNYYNSNKSWEKRKDIHKPHNRIYPVFSKRSIPDSRNEEIEHHRRTRRQLYEKIELFFSSQGKHGRQCLMKALCESQQKSTEGPGSFFEEIMKAIFTLPQGQQFESSSHQAYDEQHAKGVNCSQKFDQCKDSVFEDHKYRMGKVVGM